jgi:hypothetical protein
MPNPVIHQEMKPRLPDTDWFFRAMDESESNLNMMPLFTSIPFSSFPGACQRRNQTCFQTSVLEYPEGNG